MTTTDTCKARTPLDVARTQLGVKELTGKNDGVPAERYMRGDQLEWCAGFVMYCFDESDWPSIYLNEKDYWFFRKVATMVDDLHRRGLVFGHALHDVVSPNDLIICRRQTTYYGHVGLVEHVDLDAGKVTSIEGNVDNRVQRVTRALTDPKITCYARPHKG